MLFSHRKGLSPIRRVIQKDDMDDALRIGLWNAVYIYLMPEVSFMAHGLDTYHAKFAQQLWLYYFKRPVDTIPTSEHHFLEAVKGHFFECSWHGVYDFIEFAASNFPFPEISADFMTSCNRVLEREMSGYRFVSGVISDLTGEQEVAAIEQATAITGPLQASSSHLQQALKHLSDRKNPDYRNSVKESISAVESVCTLISGGKKANLALALRKIEASGRVKLHPALSSAFQKLYAYTSDEDGVRHALLEESNIGHDDAKFMLVACSAFVSYMAAKANASGALSD